MLAIRSICLSLLLLAGLLGGCRRDDVSASLSEDWTPGAVLEEASGVVRVGDTLLLVGDDDPGSVYRMTLGPGDAGPRIPLPSSRLQRRHWPWAGLALDLEGIERLGDGRVIVLSEQLAALVDERGLVAAYGGMVNEFGGRGLEGVAVREAPEGGSRVAVLWEGGYPSRRNLPEQLRSSVATLALQPVVWIHDIPAGARDLEFDLPDVRAVRLQVPLPAGSEPAAQRFRAPDLVWHRTGDAEGDQAWGFIAIISSGDAAVRPTYRYHWLQRFDATGAAVGDPVDLDLLVPEELRGVNWEGLGWFVEGVSLVAVFEHDPETTALQALVVPLPERWTTFGPR